ncbi:hypothetical protein M8C21_002319, partial [Ambrosia artemisiifolia]
KCTENKDCSKLILAGLNHPNTSKTAYGQMSSKAINFTKLVSFATTFSDCAAKKHARTAASNTVRDSKPTNSKSDLKRQLKDMLCEDVDVLPESEESYNDQALGSILGLSWLPTINNSDAQLHRGEVSHERKPSWVFKSKQSNHFRKLVKTCAQTLGPSGILGVLNKLDSEAGVQEFNCIIEVCIDKARNANDEDAALKEFRNAYVVFQTMRERGFKIGEETYGPCFMFIIDMGMVEEFHFFYNNIKKENPKSLSRLAYYEMLLWIKEGDEDKIQKLIRNTLDIDDSNFNGNYLLALCEADRQEEVEEIVEKFKSLHAELKVALSYGSHEKLILACCDSHEVG